MADGAGCAAQALVFVNLRHAILIGELICVRFLSLRRDAGGYIEAGCSSAVRRASWRTTTMFHGMPRYWCLLLHCARCLRTRVSY